MARCSCGGVSISCPSGCGCFCTEPPDCVRWCEPVVVEPFSDRDAMLAPGGIVRTVGAADGSQILYLNAEALKVSADSPAYPAGTRLRGCLHGAKLSSVALVLGALHGVAVSAPADRSALAVDEHVDGTLEEIAAQLGLTVG
jgi:hypothetical protein